MDDAKERYISELKRAGVEKDERIAELEAQVRGLQSRTFIFCSYCGHQYGSVPVDPKMMANAVTSHIDVCPKHPIGEMKRKLQELEAERDALAAALERIHDGACRQLAEPRNHDDDQYALTAIATVAEQTEFEAILAARLAEERKPLEDKCAALAVLLKAHMTQAQYEAVPELARVLAKHDAEERKAGAVEALRNCERRKNPSIDWRARAEKAEAELARLTTLRPAKEHDGKTAVMWWGIYSGEIKYSGLYRLGGDPFYWTPLPQPKEAHEPQK